MKAICFLCGILLLIAIARLPIGFYTFLRLAVTICSIVIIISEAKKGTTFWIIVFAIIGLVFNPVIPVYLYKKSLWMLIDLLTAATFIVYGLTYKISKNV